MTSKLNANLYDIAKTEFSNCFPDVNNGESNIGDLIINFDKNRKPISKNKRSLIPGKYRYIGATSINDYINKYNFDGIYLLLGEDGSVQDENGFPILQYTFGKFWPNNHTHVLKGKIVSTEWLYLFFSQRNIESIVTGAVQKKISQKNLNSLSVKTPTNNEIISFEKTIQPMFKKIRNNYNENLSLKKVKNELLFKLLN